MQRTRTLGFLSPSILMFAFALMAFFHASSASAQLHKDTRLGFQIKYPRSFEPIPIEPTENWTVAKFQAKTPDHTSVGKSYTRIQVRHAPGIKKIDWQGWEKSWGEPGKVRETKIAGMYAEECTFTKPSRTAQVTIVLAEEGWFAILGYCHPERFKKWKSEFSKATKSFKRIEKEERTITSQDPQEQQIQEVISRLPHGWNWERSDRYVYIYNGEKDFIRTVSRQIETMRDEFEKLYPPREPITAISIVRITGDEDTYRGYGGPAESLGYWSSANKELVLFDRKPRDQVIETLNHEAFHQYIFYWAGQLAPHSWYNEGHGDYFAGAKMTRSFKVTGYGPLRHTTRHPTVKKAWREDRLIPLQKLMSWTQAEFYERKVVYLAYAQAWALITMFRQSKKLPKQYDSLLDDYLANLLEARIELARKEREAAIAPLKRSKAPLPTDSLEDYFSRIHPVKIQALAFTKTFGAWSEEDWDKLNEVFSKFVGTIKG